MTRSELGLPKYLALLATVAVGCFALGCGSTPGGNDGGGGGGSGGGAAGGGSGGGAAGGGAGGGAECTPATVNITFDAGCASLPSPGACGGDLTGKWCYTGYCIDPRSVFPLIDTGCDGGITYSNLSGTITGSVFFDGGATAGITTRNTTTTLAGRANVPLSCYPLASTCAALQAGLNYAGLPTTCADSDAGVGTCDCDFGASDTNASAGSAYLVDGGSLTVFGSPNQTYEFCVQSSVARYRETSAPRKTESGFGMFTR